MISRAILLIGCSLAVVALGVSVTADEPRAAQAPDAPPPPDAPLPEGFPPPTAPETIEIKTYPPYRSAWTKGENMNMQSGDMLFFWLFRHISERNVAMTAPVINTYSDAEVATDPAATGELTMEFLYERPDQGEAGEGVGPVKVKDFPEMTVVALGFQGEMTPERMTKGVQRLQAWLEDHKDEWTAAGPPRRLGYHGPMTPTAKRHWEIQIPAAPTGEADDAPEPADTNLESAKS